MNLKDEFIILSKIAIAIHLLSLHPQTREFFTIVFK